MSSVSFDGTFQRLQRRILAIGGASGAAWGCVGALGLMLLGIWTDLIWELSTAARVATWGLAVLVAAGLLALFVRKATFAARQRAIARRLDETGQSEGQIVSGFELQRGGVSRSSGLTGALAQLAVTRASMLASIVPPFLAAPSKPARRAGIAAGSAFLVCLFAALVAPHLAYTEWLRFADPFGDHPPYSPTQFVVEPGDTQIRFGDAMDVVVSVTGPSVDELELVLRTTTNGKTFHDEKLPMFFDSVGHWRATVSAITVPGQYFVQSRAIRSRRYTVDVITVPQIESVRFRVTPPAYTRDAVYEGPLPQGGLSVLSGTQVEVVATSNRPLSGGTIEVASADQTVTVRLQPVTPDGASHEVRGAWTVAAAGSFHLNVTDNAGQSSRDSFSGTINLLEDHSPLVRIVEPPAQSLATPSVTVPVVISAEDDYGLTRLQLFRSLNDSRPLPVSIELPDPPARHHEQVVSLPLSAYGLEPGDQIKLFARVEDNDPAGAKGSESSVVVIQIISDEDLDRMVRAREGLDMLVSKYQEAQRRLEALQEEVEQLKKELEKRDPDGAMSDEEREKLETLAKHMEEEAQAVRESAKKKLQYDLDNALNDELKKLAQRMEDAAKDAKSAAADKPKAGDAARKLAQLQEKLNQEKKQLKEGVNDPLEKLAEIYPLLEDQNRFMELYERQRDLAERLASLKDQENPNDPSTKARMRELEAEQRRTREDLDELLGDIETHAQRLPTDDPKLQKLADSAMKFAKDVRACGAGQAMSDAELGLGEFSGGRGHDKAKSAADLLEKFLSKCKGNGSQCEGACEGLKFSPGEGSLGDTLSQLLSDAGFKPGQSGMNGQGSGGGFSARRGAMNQMGLYGRLPTRGNPRSNRTGGGKDAPSVGGSYRGDADRASSSRLDPHGLLRSAGVSETAVPVRYRGRVQQYFQRIADEAGGKK